MQSVNVVSHRFKQQDGYGRFAFQWIHALVNAGIGVRPYLVELFETPDWFQRLAGLHTEGLTIALMPAHELVNMDGRVWSFSMFEASSVPYEFAAKINAFSERLLVPCQQNVEAFRRGGVTVPIHIIPGGVAFDEFPMLPDVQRARPYTFLCLGDRGERKGMMEAYMAFHRVFSADEPVRLIVKARPEMMPMMVSQDDNRVRFWVEDVDSMALVYEQADALVFPSYAEGYGMPAREAAAMGLPVIASRHSGLADNLDCWALPLEQFTERPARSLNTLTLPADANWWVPDVQEIGALMRWCYEHQDEARAKGQAAAHWLRQHQTWEQSAQALITLMEAFA